MSTDTVGTPADQATDTPPWIPSADTFGARLALVRQRMGWGNVKKAAEECGLPVESWRTWERDGVMPHRFVTIAMAIATRTGCDYLWLVHGPQRGGATPTRQLFGQTRVVATAGDPNGRATHALHRGLSPTRSVRQTRPLSGRSGKTLAPVAV